jgi:hypothetical protein
MFEIAENAKKANDLASTVSASIPQEAKNFMQSAREKVLDNDKLRSFSAFFGIGDESSFSIQLSPTKLCPKLKDNLVFFYLNYILLTAVVFAISLLAFLMSPQTLTILAILAVVWYVVLKATEDGFKVLGCTITRKETSAIMMIISGVTAFYFFQSVFWVSLGSSSVLAFVHALTRDAVEHQLAESKKQAPLEPDEEFQ